MSLKQTVRELNWRRILLLGKTKSWLKYTSLNLLKIFVPKRTHLFAAKQIKKILIIRNDRLGDMIATTTLIRLLAKAGYEVYVSSRQGSMEIIKHNPYITGTFIYHDANYTQLIKSIRQIRKHQFDLAIDARFHRFIDLKHLIFCCYVKTNHLLGYCKSNISAYNVSIPYYFADKHVTKQFEPILQLLQIAPDNKKYDLFITQAANQKASAFLQSLSTNKIIILNPFGSDKGRCLTDEQITTICQLLTEHTVIVIGEQKLIETVKPMSNMVKFYSSTITEIMPLIRNADVVISVDTAVVHIASTDNIKTIAIYLNMNTDPKIDYRHHRDYKKYLYRHQLDQFNIELEDRFQDGKYIQTILPDRTPPINHKIWSPNNPNAIQIVFNIYPVRMVPLAEFEQQLSLAAKNLALID